MFINEASKEYLEHKNKVLNDKIRKLKKQTENKFIYDKFIMKLNNQLNKLYLSFKSECYNNVDIIYIFYFILYKLLEIEKIRFILNKKNLILVFIYKNRSYVIDLKLVDKSDKIVIFMDDYVDNYNVNLSFKNTKKSINELDLPHLLSYDEIVLYAMKYKIH